MGLIREYTIEVWSSPEDRMEALVKQISLPKNPPIAYEPKVVCRLFGIEAQLLAQYLNICNASGSECIFFGDRLPLLEAKIDKYLDSNGRFRSLLTYLKSICSAPVRIRFRMRMTQQKTQ